MFPVSLRFQDTYAPEDVKKGIDAIFRDAWRGYRALRHGDTVLVKPNGLSAKPPEAAVTTHPAVLEAVTQLLCDHGCKVAIGDSPALQKFSTVARKAGFERLARRYSARILEFDDPVEIAGPDGGMFRAFEISRRCLEFDRFINVAKFKTHSMMGLTLCVKNLFGCVPGKRKAAWHLAIGEDRRLFGRMLAELAAVLPVDFHLLDGIVAMEGNGPGNGTPTNLGVLLGGENAPAIDAVAARLVGVNPGELPTCAAASEIGTGPSADDEITPVGDPPLASPFPFGLPDPTRTDWGLPGFLKGTLRRFFLPFPAVNTKRCVGCLLCRDVCPAGAISEREKTVFIQISRCIRCYCCQEVCPEDAIVFRRRLFS